MATFKTSVECLDAFKASLEELRLDDKDIIEIIDGVKVRAEQLMRLGKNVSKTSALRQAAKEMEVDQQILKAKTEHQALLTIEKRSELLGTIKNFVKAGGLAGDGLKAIVEVFRRDVRSAIHSVGNMVLEQTRKDFGGVVQKMRAHPDYPDGSLWKDFDKDTHSKDIRSELDSRPTNNPRARAIADIIIENRTQQVLALNDQGALIQLKKNYVATQEHDWTRIRNAGLEPGARPGSRSSRKKSYGVWKNAIYNRLDHEAMFRGMSDERIDVTLEGIHRDMMNRYDGKTAEDGLTDDGAFADVDVRPVTSSLAKQVSEQRHLIFKDTENWWAYHKEFGSSKTFSNAIKQEVIGRAKKIGVMKKFGPNPELTMRGLLNDARQFVKDLDDSADHIKSLDPKQSDAAWQDSWLKVTGFGAAHGLERTKAVLAFGTFVLRSSKLGGVAITSFVMDRMTGFRGLVASGMRSMESFTGSVLRASEGNKEMMRDQLYALEGFTDRTVDRFEPGALDARTRRWTNKFFKWIGMSAVNDDNKANITSHLAFLVGRNTKNNLDKLPEPLQKDLKQAGIEAAEWDVVRRAKIIKGKNGEEHLFPSEVQALGDDAFHSVLRSQGKPVNARNIRKARTDLTDSYGIYLTDRTDSIVVTPDLTTQRQMSGGIGGTKGTQEGTYPNVALKILTQFRSFPIAYMNRFANRALHHAPASANKGMQRFQALKSGIMTDSPLWTIGTVASLIIGSFTVMQLKSLVRGQGLIDINQEDPEKQMKLFRRVLLMSGIVGIVGDIIFDEYDQSFNAAATRLLGGPAGDLINGAFTSMSHMVDGNPAKAGGQIFRTARKNYPGANVPIAGDLVNYLILDALQDMIFPGSVRERERRIKRLRLKTTGALFGPGAR